MKTHNKNSPTKLRLCTPATSAADHPKRSQWVGEWHLNILPTLPSFPFWIVEKIKDTIGQLFLLNVFEGCLCSLRSLFGMCLDTTAVRTTWVAAGCKSLKDWKFHWVLPLVTWAASRPSGIWLQLAWRICFWVPGYCWQWAGKVQIPSTADRNQAELASPKESFRGDKRQEETRCTQIYRYACAGQGNHLLIKFTINNV